MRYTTLPSLHGTIGKGRRVPDRLTEIASFGSNPGNLRARIHVPDLIGSNPPLIVVLHGCTQTAAAYDEGAGWSRLADRHGFIVLYPEQRSANNTQLCFNWFEPRDTARGSGEALSIRQMIEAVVLSHDIDPTRICITGLSAGGAMASAMLATYPEVFAGGAIIAGLPYGSASNMREAFGAMRSRGTGRPEALSALVRRASSHDGPWPTISVWHGSSDPTVSPDNGDAIVDQWLPLHGLLKSNGTSDVVDGYPHRAWRNSTGAIMVEAYSITGMGHGTPLDAGGAVPSEIAGPHMLDVGISSLRRIAALWGLAPPVTVTDAMKLDTAATPPDSLLKSFGTGAALGPEFGSPDQVGIAQVITDALRTAGLMR